MNRKQLDKWERLAESMRVERDRRRELALAEAAEWKRTESLSTPRREYTFTDEQFRIALAALEKKSAE